jgi:hypothetical protein
MRFVRLFSFLAIVFTMTASAVAQEGHPLTGTWYGNFGMASGPRHDLTVVMKWDGSVTTGTVNPGPNAVPLKTALLDVKLGTPGARGTPAVPPAFNVHFEVDAKNKTGGMDHFVFDGKIENPVAGNRRIVGTWTCGATKGDFILRRS